MPWIESHTTIARHPKTLQLAEQLRISVPTAIGHLHMLWYWALDFAPDGNLRRATPSVIAGACMWKGNASVFWQALVDAGFIDEAEEGPTVHDWYDYAGRLIEKRAANTARMRSARATNGAAHVQRTDGAQDEHVPDTFDACAGATVPNRTVPNQPTVPTVPSPPHPLSDQPKGGVIDFDEQPKRKSVGEAFEACCPNFVVTGSEHWRFCSRRPVEVTS